MRGAAPSGAWRKIRSRAFGLALKAGAAIRGESQVFANSLASSFMDTVTKHGTVIYNVGKDALSVMAANRSASVGTPHSTRRFSPSL